MQHYKRWMEEFGFEEVIKKSFEGRTNTWAMEKDNTVALYWQEILLNGLDAISLKVMGAMGWSVNEIQAFLPAVRGHS